MNRPVVLVMMAFALLMRHLMRNVEPALRRQPSPLHGKTVQRQKRQQEDAKKSVHGVGGGEDWIIPVTGYRALLKPSTVSYLQRHQMSIRVSPPRSFYEEARRDQAGFLVTSFLN